MKRPFPHAPETVLVKPQGRVLKATDEDRWVTTYGQLQDEIGKLTATRAVVERDREAERKQGYDEGYASGAKDGARAAARFLAAIKMEQKKFRAVIPHLVISIVEQFMCSVPEYEVIVKSTLSVLAENDDRGPAVLKVAPSHYHSVMLQLSNSVEGNDRGDLLASLEVLPEESLPENRSLLIFKDSVIELGLAAQLEALTQGLRDACGFEMDFDEVEADEAIKATGGDRIGGLHGKH